MFPVAQLLSVDVLHATLPSPLLDSSQQPEPTSIASALKVGWILRTLPHHQ
jgi:hypothetical protein